MLLPRVGDEFLPINPIDLFRKGEFKDTEVLLGTTADVGSLYVALGLRLPNSDLLRENPNALNETSAEKMVLSFLKNTRKINEKYIDKIIQTYFNRVENESRYAYSKAVGDILADYMITCPVMFQADFLSLKKRPVYFYLLDYKSPSSPYPSWAGMTPFEDVQYVFSNPQWKAFSVYEEELSKDVMKMWVSFAKTG